jgi:uncharacterized SAM-binding protein YcdF (DUF218 family)
MIHLIKQLVGAFSKPLVIALLIGAVAGMYQLRGRRRSATWLLVVAAAIVYLGANGLVGDTLLGPLERQYPPLVDESLPTVGYVVVLGSSYEPHDGVPVTAALDVEGLARITEGVRLVRRLGAVRLVVSGGAPMGKTPSAFGYAKLARELGVDDASLVVLNDSLDTRVEARSVVALIGAAPFILVTSASHMPRAMRMMERAGARAIPAPTGQRVNQSVNHGWGGMLPTASGLSKTEHALHEYLGLAALAAGVDR